MLNSALLTSSKLLPLQQGACEWLWESNAENAEKEGKERAAGPLPTLIERNLGWKHCVHVHSACILFAERRREEKERRRSLGELGDPRGSPA
eukprot:scaffold153764_cov15-Tisochrysis_lutea.AAC.1